MQKQLRGDDVHLTGSAIGRYADFLIHSLHEPAFRDGGLRLRWQETPVGITSAGKFYPKHSPFGCGRGLPHSLLGTRLAKGDVQHIPWFLGTERKDFSEGVLVGSARATVWLVGSGEEALERSS